MIQQIISLFIILYFLIRLFLQKKNKKISSNEFLFWLIFWIIGALLIVSIRYIDQLVLNLGFSGSGIEIVFYLGVVILFYFIFRLRIKIEKMEKDITKIVREISLNELNKK
jgi:small membrane protein